MHIRTLQNYLNGEVLSNSKMDNALVVFQEKKIEERYFSAVLALKDCCVIMRAV